MSATSNLDAAPMPDDPSARNHPPAAPGSPPQAGAGLARARRRAGLTQRQLAELVDLTTSAVRHHEHGRRALRLDHLPAYARALGTTCRRLLAELGLSCPACPPHDPPEHAPAQERQTPRPRHDADDSGALAGGSAAGDRSTATQTGMGSPSPPCYQTAAPQAAPDTAASPDCPP